MLRRLAFFAACLYALGCQTQPLQQPQAPVQTFTQAPLAHAPAPEPSGTPLLSIATAVTMIMFGMISLLVILLAYRAIKAAIGGLIPNSLTPTGGT